MKEILERLSPRVLSKLENMRKVSKGATKDDVNNVLMYINDINSLGEFDDMLGNKNVESIMIPASLKPFILPLSVRIDTTDRSSVDYLDRPIKSDRGVTYETFIESCDRIFATMKSEITSYVSAKDARMNISLSEAYKHSYVKGNEYMVYDGVNPYVPIPLTIDVYKNGIRNADIMDMLNDFIEWRLIEVFK
jgi:hypothetical protein